jgi:hypothetical protein
MGLRRGFGSVLTVVDLARKDMDATALGELGTFRWEWVVVEGCALELMLSGEVVVGQ